jgi:cell wall-associated NlpC family hydrolase
MSRLIFQACSKYIGKSYEEYNCWDLIKSLYREIYGLDVHQYYGENVPSRKETQSLIRTNKGEFERAEIPSPGDIILIRIGGVESHIGMNISKGRFIHSLSGSGVVIDSLSRYATRITGYYRHRSLK